MTHHAKASSAGSTEAGGNSRSLLRHALATRGVSSDAKGSGARSRGRLRATLAVLALAIAAFAVTAAPASAASSAKMGTVTAPSYTSAHVTGEITTSESFKVYTFEYATSESGPWSSGLSEFLFSPVISHTVQGTLNVPKGGTKYFVRLTVGGFGSPEATSPTTAPYPSFTTLAVEPPTFPGTVAASQVFSTTAKATGKVKRPANADPAFDVSACHFEYVTDAQFTATGFASATVVPCEPATPFTTPNGETEVTAPLTGLSPSTTYHLQLVAENAAPGAATKEASPFTTSAKVTAPPTVVATGNATNVDKRTAQVSGEVERPAGADPALNVSCRFEYVTDQQFTGHGFENAGQSPCLGRNEVQSLTIAATEGQFKLTYGGQTTSELPFNATAGAVQEALREIGDILVSGGPGDGAGSTPYQITIVGETDVAQIVATSSTKNPLVGTANVTTLTTGGTTFEIVNDPPMNQPKAIRGELSGLEPGTTYHLRLTAENGAGTVSKGAAATFTTVAVIPPSLTLESVSGVGYTSFTATGTAAPGNQGVDPMFEFSPVGKEEWIGNQLGRFLPVFVGQPPQQVSYTFPCSEGYCETAPLKPGTTYKVRMSGRDEEAYVYYYTSAPYLEFTTKGTSTPPSATLSVSDITGTSAHFSGTVDTHVPAGPLPEEAKVAYKTDWHFECTPECPASGALSGSVTAAEGSQAISTTLQLHAHTYYEIKLVAHNELETVETPVQIVETPLVKPSIEPAPGGSDGEGGYFIEGIVNSNNSKVTSCKFEYGTTATYPNTYNAPCLPDTSGPDEVQQVNVDAGEGQFKLSFRGQTTADIAYNATPAAVQAALRALPKVGSSGVNVTGTPQAYVVTFAGALAGTNVEPLKSSNGTTPLGGGGGGGVSVSTTTEGGNDHQVSIQAHIEHLTLGATYHFRIFATNAAGTESTSDRIFIPTLFPKGPPCPNEQLREENLSTGLPECRAYEMVTEPNKEGNGGNIRSFNGGEAVSYTSRSINLVGSGESGIGESTYVSIRTPTGWETIPNLNGPTGSLMSPPEYAKGVNTHSGGSTLAWSSDLRSSVWPLLIKGGSVGVYLRRPDGHFELISLGYPGEIGGAEFDNFLGSADLSHLMVSSFGAFPTIWGPGVYEWVGIGNEVPRRVDVDNSGSPITSCSILSNGYGNALARRISPDGRVAIVEVGGGCGGANPPAIGIWARVEGTTSYDASASLCTRVDCNAPAEPHFQGAAEDGSRIYFTTTQQLVNGDTDQTNDLYACDIPTTPQAPVGTANPCSSLHEVSAGSPGGAKVQEVLTVSKDGSTAYFTAKGVLADNEDALEEEAVAGDENLYVWRTDAAHPDGQTTFVGKLTGGGTARTTPDGRYLVLQTRTQLLSTDTDSSTDIYRYDAVTGELVRVSIGVSGAGGNAAFDAFMNRPDGLITGPDISDDGQDIVFTTKEALSPLDGNGEFDAYLWSHGHVLGSVGTMKFGVDGGGSISQPSVTIDGSGQDIYLQTAARLLPADIDAVNDLYDVRVEGGFPQLQEGCTGEACQPGATPAPLRKAPSSEQSGPGNPTSPKFCPKGKVKKYGKCFKKPKKHHKKAHQKKSRKAKQASKNRGGAK